jgi:DNA helicase HerA-like ATPase
MSSKAAHPPRDNDYEWLLGHLKAADSLAPRRELARKVGDFLESRIRSGSLPYTIGVFGGWGSGKTTFLALLAKRLEETANRRVIYFNAWKYAGFTEIVPSLIYKILRYGIVDTEENRRKAVMRVMLSLGKDHADTFGEWAKERIGVNPVRLFKEVSPRLTKLRRLSARQYSMRITRR